MNSFQLLVAILLAVINILLVHAQSDCAALSISTVTVTMTMCPFIPTVTGAPPESAGPHDMVYTIGGTATTAYLSREPSTTLTSVSLSTFVRTVVDIAATSTSAIEVVIPFVGADNILSTGTPAVVDIEPVTSASTIDTAKDTTVTVFPVPVSSSISSSEYPTLTLTSDEGISYTGIGTGSTDISATAITTHPMYSMTSLPAAPITTISSRYWNTSTSDMSKSMHSHSHSHGTSVTKVSSDTSMETITFTITG